MRKNILRQIGVVTALVLFSLISWVTVTSAVVLTVNSSHSVGDHNYAVGDVLLLAQSLPQRMKQGVPDMNAPAGQELALSLFLGLKLNLSCLD